MKTRCCVAHTLYVENISNTQLHYERIRTGCFLVYLKTNLVNFPFNTPPYISSGHLFKVNYTNSTA